MPVVSHFKPYSSMKDCFKIFVAIWSGFAAVFLVFLGIVFKYNSKYTLKAKLDAEGCSTAAFMAGAMYAVIATISTSICCKETCRSLQFARVVRKKKYWSLRDGSREERELLVGSAADPVVLGKSKVV